ncbi:MAG: hypothetical protein QOG35_1609, partial [Solirubrobacteraceae bacterium]|nr:hypothetical protein [Solirubrobacteraceae bacterium]
MERDELDCTPLPPLTLGGSVWAIRPDVLGHLNQANRVASNPDWHRIAGRIGAAAPKAARRSGTQRAGGAVAVLPLTGVITPRGSFLSLLFGGGWGGLQDFRESFREAVASPDVGAIVLEIDSPGGLIDLVPETAAEIREARGSKPIIAVANTMAASAAYWIAAQADELVVTPSGDVGSVGVYMVHYDWSGWNEQEGIAPTYISAGRYKTEGNPDEPLGDEAIADWQQEVDDLYAMFADAVAAGRDVSVDTVIAEYGEGRTLLAARALQSGLVDRIDTLEAVISGLLAPGSAGGAAARASSPPAPRAELPASDPSTPADPPAPAPVPETDPTPVPDDAPVTPPAEPAEPAEPQTGENAPGDLAAEAR